MSGTPVDSELTEVHSLDEQRSAVLELVAELLWAVLESPSLGEVAHTSARTAPRVANASAKRELRWLPRGAIGDVTLDEAVGLVRTWRNQVAHHPLRSRGGATSLRQAEDIESWSEVLANLLAIAVPAASDRVVELSDALMPDQIPQPVELLQARRSAAMRRDMLASYGYFSAEELADMHGSKAKNRYALAARWMRERKVFGVPLGARTVFPAFQFEVDGRPFPVVAEVLAELPVDDMSQWGVGLWWYAENAWLPGQTRPAELIGGPEQELLVDAARRISELEPL